MAAFGRWCCAGVGSEVSVEKRKRYAWRIFHLKELQVATQNFSHDNKLGEGGFGTVYWGKLWDGSQIAVKRLKVWSSKAEMEFAVEVEILGRVRHKNLLSLRGYCAEGQERLIVYDFMANMSVLSHLHGKHAAEGHLDWPKRMRIAIGSAEGLAYLHHYVTPHIIHRDVKASNVLLDSNFEAQVADFGFAKLIPEGVSHVTTRVKGTLGYLAPEYALWGKVSESCDVYSFGILLLELISGKKPIERLATGEKRTIVEWAAPLVFAGRLEDLVDSRLEGRFDGLQLRRLIQAATMCVQNTSDNRPTMLDVLELLTGGNRGKADGVERMVHSKKKLELDPVRYEDEMMAQDDTSEEEGKAKVPQESMEPSPRAKGPIRKNV